MNVVLGVSGSIAAYKSPDIVRKLREDGHEVRVILTKSAKYFVSDIVFQAVSGYEARSELWDKEAESAMSHIELAKWADLILLAPATAHTMAQIAMGLAPDLLSSVCLASNAQLYIAPSMNQAMWSHPSTQKNKVQLINQKARFIGPSYGSQACGDVGWGRMAEVEEIIQTIKEVNVSDQQRLFSGIKILMTAGPTRELIDPVRYISNRSSGKTGYALAKALHDAGANITMISGPTHIKMSDSIRCIQVETATEMLEAVKVEIENNDIFIATAAVCDYHPEQEYKQKIKSHENVIALELHKNVDILMQSKLWNPNIYSVGFAAETENLHENSVKKLKSKNANLIVGNLVGKNLIFDGDDTAFTLFGSDTIEDLGSGTKTEMTARLAVLIHQAFNKWKQ